MFKLLYFVLFILLLIEVIIITNYSEKVNKDNGLFVNDNLKLPISNYNDAAHYEINQMKIHKNKTEIDTSQNKNPSFHIKMQTRK